MYSEKSLYLYKRSFVFVRAVCLLLVLSFLSINRYMKVEESEAFVFATQILNERNTVIVDAGHGGEDPGAIGVNGEYEKNINLEIAMALGTALSEEGFAVIYTRTEDKMLYSPEENIKGMRKLSDLKNRCNIAAEYPEAIFISIHLNSYSQSKYSGFQAYYSEINEGGKVLASEIQSSVKERVQNNNNRVIKNGSGLYLLDNVSNPAVLLECGFLTNAEECEKLSKKEYQKELSLAIVCGIIEYRNKTLID